MKRSGLLVLVVAFALILSVSLCVTGCDPQDNADDSFVAVTDENSGYFSEKNSLNGINFVLSDDGESYSVSSYYGTDTAVVIPSEFKRKKVKEIEKFAFYENRTVVELTIPDSIEYIGERAFYRAVKLSKIAIPDSVISVGDGILEGCVSLEDLTVPQRLTAPKGDETNGCIGYLFGASSYAENGEFLSAYLRNVTMTGDTYQVYPYTFANADMIEKIGFQGNVSAIGANAFSGCTSLKEITLPESITEISDNMFSGCTSIVSVDIPSKVASLGANAFSGCTSLTKMVIPSNVKVIGGSAFSNCTALSDITIQEGVEKIEALAFYNVAATDVIIPSGIKSMQMYAFVSEKELKLHCVDESQPEGWNESWAGNCIIEWGYKNQ